jgi:hypothetical protein
MINFNAQVWHYYDASNKEWKNGIRLSIAELLYDLIIEGAAGGEYQIWEDGNDNAYILLNSDGPSVHSVHEASPQ